MTELERPKEYHGIDGLVPRTDAVIGVVGLGVKPDVLHNWQRDHRDWKFPPNALTPARKMKMIPMTDRLFVRMARGQGPPGSSPRERHRPLLSGFERFNLGPGENDVVGPTGQTSFYGFLPAGDPSTYYQINRQAQKLGQNVTKPGKRFKVFERAPDTEPAPGGGAECRGDGKLASRWMKGNDGRFGWHEITCLNDDCPFSDVCSPKSRLLVYSQPEKCGQELLLRFESPTSHHTAANLFGFITRLTEELDSFDLSHELYGLPIRMEVEMVSKGAGTIQRGRYSKQMEARRFPVVKFSQMTNVVGHRQDLARMLEAGRGSLALPAAPARITTDLEESDSMTDFNPSPPSMPRLALVPVEPAEPPDVVEAEEVETAPDDPMAKYPGAKLIAEFLGFMPRSKVLSDQATDLLTRASCIKRGEKWFNLDEKAPRELWTAALHVMRTKT